jgi:DNA-directed RNA polymerase subunit H (RpoH/RPB5)
MFSASPRKQIQFFEMVGSKMRMMLAVLLAVSVFVGPALAQNDFGNYPMRTMADLVRAHDVPEQKNADFIISADPFPSKTTVTFTGEHRPISKEKRDFILLWLETRNLPKSNADPLVKEYRFVEGDVSYWLPVVKQLEPFFDKELKKDDQIVLYYFFIGGFSKKSREWVFVAEEFQKSPTGK